MKAQLSRNEEAKEVQSVYIYIGDNKFTLQEDVEGKLVITKVDYSGHKTDTMFVNPSTGNQIKLS